MKLRHLLLLFISFFFVLPLYAEYFKHIGLSEGLTQPSVMAIYQDRLGRMWFGTKEGISQYDGNRVRIFKGWIKSVGEEPPVWLGNEVSFIVGDSLDNLYFLIDKNLIKYDIQTEKFSRLTNESVITALTSSEGQVWYMKHDSLFCLKADKEPTFVLKTNITSRICCLTMMDDQIGIGTYNGVYLIDRRTYQQKQLLEGVEIYRIFESSQKELWIGTRMHGLYRMNDKQQLSKVPYLPGTSEGISSEQIRDFVEDNEGNIWFGTFDGLHRYNYWKEESHSSDMPDEIVYHVKIWKDQIYISAHNGFFRLDTQTQKFHRINIPFAFYEHFDIDAEGNLYMVGWKNVLCTHVEHPESIVYVPLAEGDSKATPTRVLATSDGVYIGTLGMGLFFYDRQTRNMAHYTSRNNQLPGDFCYNLCRTQDGKILITGDKGVTCFVPSEGTFTTIDLMRNFPSTHIINGCGILVSGEGSIYIGDTKGVTVFSENEFNKTGTANENSNFYFSELWVDNKTIIPGDDTGILSQSLPYTRELKLNYDQNNLIIHFALSDYGQQLSEKWFQYKLEGLDKNWIKTKQTELYYTNLDPGKYTLHVASINEKSGQSLEEITMQLVIASPWYDTWWAWIIYVTAFIACVFYYVYSKIAKRTLALSLEKERFEKQQIKQLNQEKLVFFTNVSHEFRTPLTLIISHIDILLQKYSLNPSIYNQITKIRKNAQQMNKLISELLEFRKLEQNYGTIQIKQQDIIVFLKEIYLSFVDYAQQRNINYEFKLPELSVLCWFEPQLMEKVFFNLLSNAFKYTSDKGNIILSGEITNSDIKINITDTGIGISEQDKDKIFARFFQADNQEKKGSLFSGTGIGLALTRTIVEKHHGEITVKSVVGEGSTFTVRLPRRKDVFLNDKNVQFYTQDSESDIIPDSMPVFVDEGNSPIELIETKDTENKTHTVLLVEDNDELLQVLKELFEPFYKIICAHDGKEGLSQIYENSPDLVISDVMMPEMTGTEMCLQIKNNIDLCHIPVILLTALNSTEQNIEGLSRGADDYITKPFHAQLLLARANNLIRSRLLMQHQFDKKPMSEIDLASINPLDKDLLKRASQVIEQHIDDTEFDIPALCKEVGVGRSLLYTKFKALTGMTPNNFLLNYRLKHAATLLKQYPDLPIAEVSDRSGFNAPVYFSRCFKNQFGCTPQNYRKEKKQAD